MKNLSQLKGFLPLMLADPQMFQLLMTAVPTDANIIVKYESTTNMVTSIEIA